MRKILLTIFISLCLAVAQAQVNITSTNTMDNFCSGMCMGSAQINATGTGTITYTINPNWMAMQTTPGNFSNLCAGPYTVVATDAISTTASTTFYISEPPPITMVVQNPTPDTCGQCVGSVQVQAIGGVFNYTYNINPAATSIGPLFTNLCSGSAYTITVVDNNGCTASTQHTAMSVGGTIPGLIVTTTDYDASCNLTPDGGIDLTATPNIGLTYNWSNGATSEDIANVANGNYGVLITNSNGDCMEIFDTIGVLGTNCGTISGKVYVDMQNDCVQNTQDFNVMNRILMLSTGDMAITNPNGEYYFSNVPYGTHTLSEATSPYYFPNGCIQPSNIVINATSPNSVDNHFKDSVNTTPDELLTVIGTRYIPGFPPAYYGAFIKLLITNQTPLTLQNKVTLLLNDSLDMASASIVPASVIPTAYGDSITWFVTTPPFSNWSNSATNEILVYINTPTNLTMGSVLTSCATLTPLNYTDVNMNNNTGCISKEVATSFDPNDKQVQPEGIGAPGYITLQDSVFDYTIRFQNTGTAPAMNVYILDTLSTNLDVQSIMVMGYSHPYDIEIIDGHIIKFKFINIMLPDSGTDMQGSNGYITYRIKQKSTNQPGDFIYNTASIYFDYNSPIVTNTTVNTIMMPVQVATFQTEPNDITLYPNPASSELIIRIPFSTRKGTSNAIIEIYNTLGQLVWSEAIVSTNSDHRIPVDALPKGVYQLKIMQDEKIYSRSFIKE